MPAKYFPSLSPQGIDYNSMPNLGDVAQGERGSDSPLHYGFTGTKGPQSPYAGIAGQTADALMDPRMGMVPGAGLAGAGFRAVGRMGIKGAQVAREAGEGLDRAALNNMGKHAAHGALQEEPSPFLQATTMRQPQGDQSMGKALQGLQDSLGWSSEKMADWLTQNGFRGGGQ